MPERNGDEIEGRQRGSARKSLAGSPLEARIPTGTLSELSLVIYGGYKWNKGKPSE